ITSLSVATMLILLWARFPRLYISNKTSHTVAVASSHMNVARRAGIFEKRRSARGNEMVKIVRAGHHSRSIASFCPRSVRKIRNDDIYTGLGKMINPGGDQRRRVRRAPEAVHQCADFQVAEMTIVLHLLTRHEYPSGVLAGVTFRALSTNPEPSEAGYVGRIHDVQSRGVRPHRYSVVQEVIIEDPVRPGAESLLH